MACAAASAAGLLPVLERIAEGVAILDGDGRVVYVNPALAALLAEDREGGRLSLVIGALARELVAGRDPRHAPPASSGAPLVRELRTAAAPYRISATSSPAADAGCACLLILVERVARRTLAATELARRFGLTRREWDVALLLARGFSNADIAAALGVSIHTARRHVEHVLAKLGVHSRAEAGAVVRGEDAEGARCS